MLLYEQWQITVKMLSAIALEVIYWKTTQYFCRHAAVPHYLLHLRTFSSQLVAVFKGFLNRFEVLLLFFERWVAQNRLL